MADRKRIGVYTICKNESKFVKRWIESMWSNGNGADAAYVLDTGSTDGTVRMFKETVRELGIPHGWLKVRRKLYRHFRFDVARNDNLDMIPPNSFDALVSVDLDEILIPEFWGDLRKLVAEHPDFLEINYMYAWNHDENGNNGRVFWYNKVHQQNGFRWKGAVHEWRENVEPEKYQYSGQYYMDENIVYLHHYPDNTKSRGQYLGLLEERVKDMPDDMNTYVYLMNEYLAHGMTEKAFVTANLGYLKDKSRELQFLFAARIADIYSQCGFDDEADRFYRIAIEKDKTVRNSYINYAQFLAYHGKAKEALCILIDMEQNNIHHHNWMELDYDWTWRPLQIRADAYCWLGKYDEAKKLFEEAEEKYLQTEKDRAEAQACAFFDDYDWLKNRLNEIEGAVT